MPRLRDVRTGVVVNVDDATAERLSATHKPMSSARPAKPAPSRSTK